MTEAGGCGGGHRTTETGMAGVWGVGTRKDQDRGDDTDRSTMSALEPEIEKTAWEVAEIVVMTYTGLASGITAPKQSYRAVEETATLAAVTAGDGRGRQQRVNSCQAQVNPGQVSLAVFKRKPVRGGGRSGRWQCEGRARLRPSRTEAPEQTDCSCSSGPL